MRWALEQTSNSWVSSKELGLLWAEKGWPLQPGNSSPSPLPTSVSRPCVSDSRSGWRASLCSPPRHRPWKAQGLWREHPLWDSHIEDLDKDWDMSQQSPVKVLQAKFNLRAAAHFPWCHNHSFQCSFHTIIFLLQNHVSSPAPVTISSEAGAN